MLCFCSCRRGGGESIATTAMTEQTTASVPAQTQIYEFVMKLPFAQRYIPDQTESGRRLAEIYRDIELELGVRIKIEYSAGSEEYIPAAMAEKKYADVIGLRPYEIYSLAKRRYILSTDDAILVKAGLNVNDQSRFYNGVAGQVTWEDKQWSLQIPSEYHLPSVGSFLLYNHGILSSLGEGNIKNLAETGKWTWQQYLDFSKAAAALGPDISGSGIVDRMGAAFSCGGQLLTEKGGAWTVAASQVPFSRGVSYLLEAISPANNADRATAAAELYQNFIDGKIAFLAVNGSILEQNPLLLSAAGGVGVLPLPKNSELERYASLTSDYQGFGFLSNYHDAQRGIPVFNALAAELYRDDWSTLCAQGLGLEGRDCAVMSELVIENSVFSKADYDPRIPNSVGELLDGADYTYTPSLLSMAIEERILALLANPR